MFLSQHFNNIFQFAIYLLNFTLTHVIAAFKKVIGEESKRSHIVFT